MSDRRKFDRFRLRRPTIGPQSQKTEGRQSAMQFVHCGYKITYKLSYVRMTIRLLTTGNGASCFSKMICTCCSYRDVLGRASIHHAIQLNSKSNGEFDMIWINRICFSYHRYSWKPMAPTSSTDRTRSHRAFSSLNGPSGMPNLRFDVINQADGIGPMAAKWHPRHSFRVIPRVGVNHPKKGSLLNFWFLAIIIACSGGIQ